MDNYQAVYDAVRSKFHFNAEDLYDRLSYNSGIAHAVEVLKNELLTVAYEMQRPCVIFKPQLFRNGVGKWCALLGDDKTGVMGTGDSPAEAMEDFDKKWVEKNGK